MSKRGYFDLAVNLDDGNGRRLLSHHTSLGLLPPDTRKHRAESPFGTYSYGSGLDTCGDMDKVGPLYVKLGMRYAMSGSRDQKKKYGLVQGNEPQFYAYEKTLEHNPDVPPMVLIEHEAYMGDVHDMRRPMSASTGRPL